MTPDETDELFDAAERLIHLLAFQLYELSQDELKQLSSILTPIASLVHVRAGRAVTDALQTRYKRTNAA